MDEKLMCVTISVFSGGNWLANIAARLWYTSFICLSRSLRLSLGLSSASHFGLGIFFDIIIIILSNAGELIPKTECAVSKFEWKENGDDDDEIPLRSNMKMRKKKKRQEGTKKKTHTHKTRQDNEEQNEGN